VDPGSGNGNNGFKNIATSRSIGGDVVAVVAVVAVDVVVVVLGYHCDSRDREGTWGNTPDKLVARARAVGVLPGQQVYGMMVVGYQVQGSADWYAWSSARAEDFVKAG